MNPITLPIADLKPALMGLSKVIAKRASLPVLSTIRIDRDNGGRISLSATDLDRFITTQITSNESGQPGSVLVPFTALNNIAKACQGNDELQISPDNKGFVSIRYPIGNQTAAQRIESLPVEEWPPIPKVESNPIPLPTSMRSALLEAMQCSSDDETRYVLQGACIDVSDPKCHNVVATNGRHLYSSNSFNIPLKESVIIPESKFLEWRGFAEDGDWSLQVWGDKESPWLRLESDHWSFITKPIEGNYPNWRQVVPDKDATKSSVLFPEDSAAVLQAIQKLPDPDQTNHTIGLRLDRHRLTLLGRDPSNGEETAIGIDDAQIKGEPVTIHLNRQYLAKALKFGLRELQISDPLSPMRFVAGGRQLVVMPVRTGSEDQVHPTVPAKSEESSKPQAETEPSTTEAAITPVSQPSTERNPMQTNNDSHTQPIHEAGPVISDRPALEIAIAQVEILKGDFRNAIVGLNKLSEALKTVQREQKAGDREVQLVRAALGKLQAVRF